MPITVESDHGRKLAIASCTALAVIGSLAAHRICMISNSASPSVFKSMTHPPFWFRITLYHGII